MACTVVPAGKAALLFRSRADISWFIAGRSLRQRYGETLYLLNVRGKILSSKCSLPPLLLLDKSRPFPIGCDSALPLSDRPGHIPLAPAGSRRTTADALIVVSGFRQVVDAMNRLAFTIGRRPFGDIVCYLEGKPNR